MKLFQKQPKKSEKLIIFTPKPPPMPPTQVAVKFLNIEIKSGVAFYTISVTDLHTKETWLFQSRYSRMRQVHDSLSILAKDEVPIFPPKRCCFNTEPAFVSQRQKALENYFNIVLKNGDLVELAPLKQFLYSEKSMPKGKKPPVAMSKGFSDDRDYNNIYLGPKKSLGLKNAVDSFAFRFIDLGLNLTPPEEDDIRRKRAAVMAFKWPKVVSKMLLENQLPKGNEQNLIFLKKGSLVRRNEEFYAKMEKAMRNLCFRTLELEDFFKPNDIVHEIVVEK